MTELAGSIGTGAGRTSVTVRAIDDGAWTVNVYARWMGDAAALDVTFSCTTIERARCFEALRVTGAADAAGNDISLPPHDDALVFELVRVPAPDAKEPISAVIWLHPQSYYDPGDQLPADDYDVPPERFAPTAKALAYLEAPWKLATTAED